MPLDVQVKTALFSSSAGAVFLQGRFTGACPEAATLGSHHSVSAGAGERGDVL